VEVVEGATVKLLSHGKPTVIIVGLVLSVFGIDFLCLLPFTLAIYALPFYLA
jgi:hypothetical protein